MVGIRVVLKMTMGHAHGGDILLSREDRWWFFIWIQRRRKNMQKTAVTNPGRSALLIIDMQNDFVRPGGPLQVAGAEQIVPAIRDVLHSFRKARLPVFHVIRVHRSTGVDVEITRRDIFRTTPFAVEGTPGAAVIRELEPSVGEHIVKKTRMSAFFNTDLDLMLRALGVGSLIVTGIQTPNCIRTTVFDAMAHNYEVFLVRDAVAAKSEEIHRANVTDMQNIGIHIVSSSEVPGLLS